MCGSNSSLCDSQSVSSLDNSVNIMHQSDCRTSSSRPSFSLQQQLLLQPFNSLFSRSVWVSQYQKGKTSLDWYETSISGISWTISKQSAPCSTAITTRTPHQSIVTGQMLFLTPNQQCQSTEGKVTSLSLSDETVLNLPTLFLLQYLANTDRQQCRGTYNLLATCDTSINEWLVVDR